MGNITVSLPSDGNTASVADYNTPINTIVTAINGNLDNTNISGVSGAKVSAGTLPSTALTSALAGGWLTDSNTYTYSANNGNKEFVLSAANDPTTYLSPGMKFKINRGTTPPTQCMSFVSASSQYATKASPTGILFTSAFTCEAWVYLNSYTGSDAFIVGRTDNSTAGFALIINSSGQLKGYYGASSVFNIWTSYQTVPLNTWVHVAFAVTSVSAKTANMYINGTLVSSSFSGTSTTMTQTGNLTIGAANAGVASTFFNGYISEARIWSAAQSQASIQANMAINLTGSESNLVGLWQGSGNFTDTTSNANTLTATGGAIATQAANPYNATEFARVRAVSSTTITLYTGDVGTIPNMTLNTPLYSTQEAPLKWPQVLNSKVMSMVIWGANQGSTATATGTQLNGASITLTIPTGGKRVLLHMYTASLKPGAGTAVLDAYWGSSQIARGQAESTTNGTSVNLQSIPFWATAGSQTFSIDMWETSAGTATLTAATSELAFFTVEEA